MERYLRVGTLLRRTGRVLFWFFLSILILFLILTLLLRVPRVQSFTVNKVANHLSKKLDTEVSVGGVELKFFSKIVLNDVLIEDQGGDTLLFTQSLRSNIEGFNPFKKILKVDDIVLEKPQIGFWRSADSVWNHAFIAEALKKDTSQAKEPFEWDIDLNALHLKEPQFFLNDSVKHNQMALTPEAIRLKVRQLNFPNNSFALSALDIDNLEMDYIKRKKPPPRFDSNFNLTDKVDFDTSMIDLDAFFAEEVEEMGKDFGIDLSLGQFQINGGKIRYRNFNKTVSKQKINFNDLRVQNIETRIEDIRVRGDSVVGRMEKMRFKEISGFKLENLTADLLVKDGLVAFKGMALKTKETEIRDYYAMEFDKWTAFNNYIEEVDMTAQFNHALVSGDDLEYFIPNFEASGVLFDISGEMEGKVNRLRGKELKVYYGGNSYFDGEITLNDLLKKEEFFMQLSVNEFHSNYYDLPVILQGVQIPSNLKNAGRLNFQGEFTGFLNDFVAFGTLNSELGLVKTDINLKIDPKTSFATYSGNVSTQAFDLGKWVGGSRWLGPISLNTSLKGSGLTQKSAKSFMEGEILSFTFNNYTYKNLQVKGNLKRDLFSGEVVSKDPNFDLDFEGSVDFTGELPDFDLTSEVRALNLFALNFSKDSLEFSGSIEADIRGNVLDNLDGQAQVKDVVLSTSKKQYAVDHFTLESTRQSGRRDLVLQTDFLQAKVEGDFKLSELPFAFTNEIKNYYPALPLETKDKLLSDRLEFDLKVNDPKNILGLLVPEIQSGIENAFVQGVLDPRTHYVELMGDVPEFHFADYKFNKTSFAGASKGETFEILTSAKSLKSDKVDIQDISLQSTFVRDSLFIDLNLTEGASKNNLELKGKISSLDNGFAFEFPKAEFVLNGKTWTLQPGNRITLINKEIFAKNVRFDEGAQSISLSSLQTPGFDSHLKLKFNESQTAELLSSFGLQFAELGGVLNGSVDLYNLYSTPIIEGKIKVADFSVAKTPLGNLDAFVRREGNSDVFTIEAQLENENRKCLDLEARYLGNQESLVGLADLSAFPIRVAEPFLKGEVRGMGGLASGQLKISGKPSNPEINGQVTIPEAQFTIDYLNVPYTIPNFEINITPGKFSFNDRNYSIHHRDKKNWEGEFAGSVSHNKWKNFVVDGIAIGADSFMFMNTTKSLNEYFYGRFNGGESYVYISGPFEDITISAESKTLKGTQLTIPVTYGKETKRYDFVRFVNPTKDSLQEKEENYSLRKNQLRVSLAIEITPEAQTTIVIDESTGDQLQGYGEGNVSIDIDPQGNLSMVGGYTISEGTYSFRFEDVVTKEFQIKEGSSVKWDGDPYLADLNVTALYSKAKTSKYDLISNFADELSGDELANSKRRIRADVELKLEGSLESPDIEFDILLPENEAPGTIFSREFSKVKADANEMNKQVFALIALNRFLPSGEINALTPVTSGVNSTVTEFLSAQFSSYFGEIISSFDEGLEVDIDYNSYNTTTDELGLSDSRRNAIEVAVRRKLFNDRVSIEVGGNLDFGEYGQEATSSHLAGDFIIEYSITKDGRLRVRAFRKGDIDVIREDNITKTGVGLSFKRRFDNFKELVKIGKN